MLAIRSVAALLGCIATFTSATALTFKLHPNAKECFYAHNSQVGSKMSFYFAVQSGGDFDSQSEDSTSG